MRPWRWKFRYQIPHWILELRTLVRPFGLQSAPFCLCAWSSFRNLRPDLCCELLGKFVAFLRQFLNASTSAGKLLLKILDQPVFGCAPHQSQPRALTCAISAANVSASAQCVLEAKCHSLTVRYGGPNGPNNPRASKSDQIRAFILVARCNCRFAPHFDMCHASTGRCVCRK
jgi:hypothetical protein